MFHPRPALGWPDHDARDHQEELNIRSHASPPQHGKSHIAALACGLILAWVAAPGAPGLAARDKPAVQYKIAIPAPPDFSALEWLQGEWTGKTVTNNPGGEVKLSVSPDLEKRVMVLRGEVSLAATSTVPATRESWLGILSAGSGGTDFILRVFSSTGFVTRYRLTVEGAEIQMNPEGGDAPPPGWLFRRTWARTGNDEMNETVQTAPPGRAFFDYYTAKLSRVPPAAKTAPHP
jgi:hypothetical protein